MTTSRSVRAGFLFIASLALTRGLRAQQADLILGATRPVGVATGDGGTAFAPSLALGGARWRFTSELHTTDPQRSSRLGATLSAAALGPRLGPFHTELVGDLLTPSVYSAGDARIAARFHLAGATRGLWLGTGAARTFNEAAWLRTFGGWTHGRLGTLSLRIDQTTGAGRTTRLGIPDTLHGPAPLRTQGVSARFAVPSGRLELTLGASKSSGTLAGRRQEASGMATWWVNRSVALSGGYGSPIGGGFVPMKGAVRFGILWRPFKAMPRGLTLLEPSGIVAAGVERVGRDEWRIKVPANGAHTVEVEGTFDEWEPVALEQSEPGWWTVTLSLPPGRHELIWRRDEGSWRALPGLPTQHDDLLGDVTVVVIDPE